MPFLITGHVSGCTLGTGGPGEGSGGRPLAARVPPPQAPQGAWSPILGGGLWASVGCRGRHHLQGKCRRVQPGQSSPSLPSPLHPCGRPPDLSQFLQRLAVYLPTIQAVDPAVWEREARGRARPGPPTVYRRSPPQEPLPGVLVSELKSVWTVTDRSSEDTAGGKETELQSGSLLPEPRLAKTSIDTSKYWVEAGLDFLGHQAGEEAPATSPAFPTISCPLGFEGMSPLLPGRWPF